MPVKGLSPDLPPVPNTLMPDAKDALYIQYSLCMSHELY